MINCFCCYVIKLAGEIDKKVLLSVIWNLQLIEIHLSQIRISESKREKVCAVCPYLLFCVVLAITLTSFLKFIQVVVDLCFTTILTSQIIRVAFHSEREKSDKFCSEAPISASGCFTCRKSTTRDPRLYFPSEGSNFSEFLRSEKNPSTPAEFEPANLGSSGKYDNHGTTWVDNMEY